MRHDRLSRQGYIVSLLVLFLVLALWPTVARGHGPKDVTLSYNTDSGTLNIIISHTVSNPQKHYIKSVSITRNGELVTTREYTGQPESSPFAYTYPVEAKAGDVLKVTAHCNYFGSKAGEITIDK